VIGDVQALCPAASDIGKPIEMPACKSDRFVDALKSA
jgi:hypothetical protein